MAKLKSLKKFSAPTTHTPKSGSPRKQAVSSGTPLVSVSDVQKIRDKVIKKLDENPQKALQILLHWIRK